jgi:hypothetical protein
MGTLLISKIREEYPDRMMLVPPYIHSCPALQISVERSSVRIH